MGILLWRIYNDEQDRCEIYVGSIPQLIKSKSKKLFVYKKNNFVK
jgi:hypothetical protein